MTEKFENKPNCSDINGRLQELSLNFPEEKKIDLNSEKKDLDGLLASITNNPISENNDYKIEPLPKDVMPFLSSTYKRIVGCKDGKIINVGIDNLDNEEKEMYQEYIQDYRYMKEYVMNPIFREILEKRSGLEKKYLDRIFERIQNFFKYDTPQNELIIDNKKITNVNARKISFLGKGIENSIIILHKENKDRHFGAHEISHLIFDGINKIFTIQPKFDLFEDNSFIPEDIKNYVRKQDEHYPHLFQLRAKYNIQPGQKILLSQAERLIAENRDNIVISMMSPKELRKIMNSW